jgi:hypothetical protein
MCGFRKRVPVGHAAGARRGRKRIGDFLAMPRIGFGEFSSAPAAHGLRQVALKIAEERERLGRTPFLAHEQQRRRGLQQQHG